MKADHKWSLSQDNRLFHPDQTRTKVPVARPNPDLVSVPTATIAFSCFIIF